MVTGDSQEEVMIFRDRQTELHHKKYIGRVVVPDDGEDTVAARQSLAFFVQPDDDVQ